MENDYIAILSFDGGETMMFLLESRGGIKFDVEAWKKEVESDGTTPLHPRIKEICNYLGWGDGDCVVEIVDVSPAEGFNWMGSAGFSQNHIGEVLIQPYVFYWNVR